MRKHVSPGVILGSIAVVLAMAGSAVAASKITGAQIKDGTVTSKDIKNGSISRSDLSGAALDGMQGPQGLQGPAGTPGAPGLAGVVAVESAHFTLAPGAYSPISAVAQCPPGKVVIGTGFVASIAHTGFVKAYGTFVGGFIYNDASVSATDLSFQAICASASGAVASSAARASSKYQSDRSNAVAHAR